MFLLSPLPPLPRSSYARFSFLRGSWHGWIDIVGRGQCFSIFIFGNIVRPVLQRNTSPLLLRLSFFFPRA